MSDIRPLAVAERTTALALHVASASLPAVAAPDHLTSLIEASDKLVVLGKSNSAIVAHEHAKVPFRYWPWPAVVGAVAAGVGCLFSPFAAELIGAAGFGIAAAMGAAMPVARHLVRARVLEVGAITDTTRLLPSQGTPGTGDVLIAQRAAKLRDQLRSKKVNNPELVALCHRLEAAAAGATPEQVEHAKRWLALSDFCDAPDADAWDDAKSTYDGLPPEERTIIAPLMAAALRSTRARDDWSWKVFEHIQLDLTPAFALPVAGPSVAAGPDATLSAMNRLADFCKATGVEKYSDFHDTRDFPALRALAVSASEDTVPDVERALLGIFTARLHERLSTMSWIAVDFRESLAQLTALADAQPASAKAEAARILRAIDNVTNDAYTAENLYRPSKFESGQTIRQIAGSMELGLVRFNR